MFSGLVPVASRQDQREPACTYMLECCVRPDVEAVRMLHVVSLVREEKNGVTRVSLVCKPSQLSTSFRVSTFSFLNTKTARP